MRTVSPMIESRTRRRTSLPSEDLVYRSRSKKRHGLNSHVDGDFEGAVIVTVVAPAKDIAMTLPGGSWEY